MLGVFILDVCHGIELATANYLHFLVPMIMSFIKKIVIVSLLGK